MKASPQARDATPVLHCACTARTVGRSVDRVRPAIVAAPPRSTATVVPSSPPRPPKYVAYATTPRRVTFMRNASGQDEAAGGPLTGGNTPEHVLDLYRGCTAPA